MTTTSKVISNTQQVGRSGELLVQYKLLKFGIDSAPMTTDRGIDLVARLTTSGRVMIWPSPSYAAARTQPGGLFFGPRPDGL